MPSTLVDRMWEGDLVREESAEPALLYVDLYLVHDVTSLEAFAALRLAGRSVRRSAIPHASVP